jgi:2-methylisocitrate lyase-like PEP mutase family enzyme
MSGQNWNIQHMHGAQEALWRVAAFADAGADILFVDALESADEMRALCSAGGVAGQLPKVR